jgi:predicted MFS family arabinose efflux permease
MVSFTDRIGKRNSLAIGLGGAALALLLLGVVNDELGYGIGALALFTIFIEFAIISGVPLATELRPGNRSRFLAWFLVAMSLGRVIADLIGPRIFQSRGMTAITLTAAGAAVAGVAILLTGVREAETTQPGITPTR